MLLTTGVLVVVIAFGAAIKPLANDQLLGAGQTLKYIGLAMIPMMQFALPFAAGFAATMTLHRMAADNEIQAAAVGGVSYRRLLVPVAGLGLAMTLLMVGLTQWLIPQFFGLMKQAVAADVTRMFEASIGKGIPIQVGNLQIYADRMIAEDNPQDTDADTRIHLWGMVAAELDDGHRVETDVTAHRAVVDIYRRSNQTLLKLILEDTVGYNSASRELVRTPIIKPRRAIVLPMFLDDDPLTKTRGELLVLRDHPDDYSRVAEARLDLSDALRNRARNAAMNEYLLHDGQLHLTGRHPPGRTIVLRADGIINNHFFRKDAQPVEIELRDSNTPPRHIASSSVTLQIEGTSPFGEGVWGLEVQDGRVTDLNDPGISIPRTHLTVPGIIPLDLGLDAYRLMSTDDLLARISEEGADTPGLTTKGERVTNEIILLRREIRSRMMKRYALSVIVVLVLLLGAIFAMLLRSASPLVVYLWAFVPSILNLILISGGEQMLRDGHSWGGVVLWSGSAVLAILCFIGYFKLARH